MNEGCQVRDQSGVSQLFWDQSRICVWHCQKVQDKVYVAKRGRVVTKRGPPDFAIALKLILGKIR